jgi:hypothetical protein
MVSVIESGVFVTGTTVVETGIDSVMIEVWRPLGQPGLPGVQSSVMVWVVTVKTVELLGLGGAVVLEVSLTGQTVVYMGIVSVTIDVAPPSGQPGLPGVHSVMVWTL